MRLAIWLLLFFSASETFSEETSPPNEALASSKPLPPASLLADAIYNKQTECDAYVELAVIETLNNNDYETLLMNDEVYTQCLKILNDKKRDYVKRFIVAQDPNVKEFSISLSNGQKVTLPVPPKENVSESEIDFQQVLCVANKICITLDGLTTDESPEDPNEWKKYDARCLNLVNHFKVKHIVKKKLDINKLWKDKGLSIVCAGGTVKLSMPEKETMTAGTQISIDSSSDDESRDSSRFVEFELAETIINKQSECDAYVGEVIVKTVEQGDIGHLPTVNDRYIQCISRLDEMKLAYIKSYVDNFSDGSKGFTLALSNEQVVNLPAPLNVNGGLEADSELYIQQELCMTDKLCLTLDEVKVPADNVEELNEKNKYVSRCRSFFNFLSLKYISVKKPEGNLKGMAIICADGLLELPLSEKTVRTDNSSSLPTMTSEESNSDESTDDPSQSAAFELANIIYNKQKECDAYLGELVEKTLEIGGLNNIPVPEKGYNECMKGLNENKRDYIKRYLVGLNIYCNELPMRLSRKEVVTLPAPGDENSTIVGSEVYLQQKLCVTNKICTNLESSAISEESDEERDKLEDYVPRCFGFLDHTKLEYIKMKNIDESDLKKTQTLDVVCADGVVSMPLPKKLNKTEHQPSKINSEETLSSTVNDGNEENENSSHPTAQDLADIIYNKQKDCDRYVGEVVMNIVKNGNIKKLPMPDERYIECMKTLDEKKIEYIDKYLIGLNYYPTLYPMVLSSKQLASLPVPDYSRDNSEFDIQQELCVTNKLCQQLVRQRFADINAKDVYEQEERVLRCLSILNTLKLKYIDAKSLGAYIFNEDRGLPLTCTEGLITLTLPEKKSNTTPSFLQVGNEIESNENVHDGREEVKNVTLVARETNHNETSHFNTVSSDDPTSKLQANSESSIIKPSTSSSTLTSHKKKEMEADPKKDSKENLEIVRSQSSKDDKNVAINEPRVPARSLEDNIVLKENDCKELLQFGEQLMQHKLLTKLTDFENHYNECMEKLDALKRIYMEKNHIDVTIHKNMFPLTLTTGESRLVPLPKQLPTTSAVEARPSRDLKVDDKVDLVEFFRSSDREHPQVNDRKPFDDPAFIQNDEFLRSLQEDTSTLAKVASMFHMNVGRADKKVIE